MSNEFHDTIPSLTLEPELQTPAVPAVVEETPAEPKVAEPVLTPEEQQIVNEFAA